MWLALASSALLFFASYGLGELWPLAWIAPAPVWTHCWRERKNFWIAGAAHLLGSLNMAAYYADVMPAAVAITALVLISLLFMGLTSVASRCAERCGWIAGPFAFPALWTALEWIRTQVSPHGAAGSLADGQTDFLAALQIVSVTGFPGLTFLMLLVPAAIACFWISRRPAVLAAPAALFAAALLFGATRIRNAEPSPTIAVAAVASDGPQTTVEAYAKRIDLQAARGAKFVVLPEKFVTVKADNRESVYATFSDAAARNRATVIAGFTLVESNKRRNVAVVFGPRGETLGTYDKHHMVPGWESDLEPGTRTLVIDDYGVAICKDFDFPSLTAQYGEQGAGMMFAPAWDFTRDAKLHSRMAVMRAVEQGFTLVRSARQGKVTVADAYGRILAEDSTIGVAEASVLVLNAPKRRVATLYSTYGDWFGILTCLMAAGFVIRSYRRMR